MQFGYKVTGISPSGEDAIEKVESDPPDLILMDIVLQGELTGIEAARMIGQRHDVPVIFLTAYDNHYLVEEAKQTENYGYLLKPFKDKELSIAIEMALGRVERERRARLGRVG